MPVVRLPWHRSAAPPLPLRPPHPRPARWQPPSAGAAARPGVPVPAPGCRLVLDLLFVTLRKSEALFSPTTRYRDLALGPSLFHWESQSTTTAASATGQRYLHHEARGSRVLLMVREQRREGGRGGGAPSGLCAWGLRATRATRGSGRWRSGGGWSGRSRWGGCR